MTDVTITGIAPLLIVADVPAALSFYRDKLGFAITFRGPSEQDVFFGIVRRGGATIMLKALGEMVEGKEVRVPPVPNYARTPAHCWDAYVHVADPEALAEEFSSRDVVYAVPLSERGDDGGRGFVVTDFDGYGLFFGNHDG